MIAPITRGASSDAREIAKAVAIAGLSALATELVKWGVEAVRNRLKAADSQAGDQQ